MNCKYKKELIKDNRFNEIKTIEEDEDFNKRVRKGKRANILDVLYIYNSGRDGSLTDLYCKGQITRELQKVQDTQILFYQKAVSVIGGIETFLFEVFKALKDDYDILFVYDTADYKQLRRYKELVKCVKNKGKNFTCDK